MRDADWWIYERQVTPSGAVIVRIATKRGRRTSVTMPPGKPTEAAILEAAGAAVDLLFGRLDVGP